MKHFFEESSPLRLWCEYNCIWVCTNDLTEQLLQENVPLRHLLNEEVVFKSWRRSVNNEENDLARSHASIELIALFFNRDLIICSFIYRTLKKKRANPPSLFYVTHIEFTIFYSYSLAKSQLYEILIYVNKTMVHSFVYVYALLAFYHLLIARVWTLQWPL